MGIILLYRNTETAFISLAVYADVIALILLGFADTSQQLNHRNIVLFLF